VPVVASGHRVFDLDGSWIDDAPSTQYVDRIWWYDPSRVA
jgi:hypothetical protein